MRITFFLATFGIECGISREIKQHDVVARKILKHGANYVRYDEIPSKGNDRMATHKIITKFPRQLSIIKIGSITLTAVGLNNFKGDQNYSSLFKWF